MDPLLSLPAFAALAFGYLLGSVPFGFILTKAAGLGDVRNIGSGNIGATNVLRTGHKGMAALTLLLDALKGTVAVLVAQYVGGQHGIQILAGLLAGLGAFLGHIFPVWLGFKGGKGVATYIGVLLGIFWPAALLFCACWLLVAVITRYSSLSALAASIFTPGVLVYQGDYAEALLAAVMTGLLMWKHSSNISRLTKGEEPKIGDHKIGSRA
ncbi:MAG: glycerol-3-phosphate 1-O-acyltransferase PlsY [Hyphomicrobium sp.]